MVRKRKRSQNKVSKKRLLTMYRTVVVVLIIVGVGTIYVSLVSPLISDSRQVLGTETYLAQGKNVRDSKTNPAKERINEKIQNNSQQVDEGRIEKLKELPPINAETKSGNGRIDITRGGVMTEIEKKSSESGFTIRADKGNGSQEELTADTIKEIKSRLNETDIQIATDGGGLVVGKRHIGARTNFPLSIDLSTNTLIVTTPNGQKAVAVLPDKAVQNILSKGILSKIGGGIASGSADLGGDATDSANITFGASSVEESEEKEIEGSGSIALEIENGELVYKVEGESEQKLFGFVPVGIKKTVVVSAENGEVISESSPILHRLLNLLSR